MDLNGNLQTLYIDPGSGRHVACCAAPIPQQPIDKDQCTNGTYVGLSAFVQANLKDTDGDFVRDPFDNCVNIANIDQADRDHDLIGDVCDNCPGVPNQDQANTTGATIGDACNCALAGVQAGPTGAPCSTGGDAGVAGD